MTTVGFVILAWNSMRTLPKCLASIFVLKGVRADVVLVDNGSSDDTGKWLSSFRVPEPHALEVIALPKNFGMSVSRNRALERILRRDCQFIAVIDSDIVVNEVAVVHLMRYLEDNPACGVVGPQLYGHEGIPQPNAKVFPTFPEKFLKGIPMRGLRNLGERYGRLNRNPLDTRPFETDYLMGAFLMVRSEVFRRTGFFDPKIFYGPEDAEFCLRVWRSGYRVVWCPSVSVYHEWQRLSRRRYFSRTNYEHVKGLAHLFLKYRYCLTAKGLRQRSGFSTFDSFKNLEVADCKPLSESEMRALKDVLLAILDDIHSAAASCDVPVSLGGGSALGALRHGGFIPWDDDLDVNLMRCDWPRLREAIRTLYPDRYAIYEPGHPSNYALAFPRIRLKGTCVKTRDDLVSPVDCLGASVDLFLLDAVPDNVFLRKCHGWGSLALGFLYSCRKAFAERTWQRRWGLTSGVFRVKRTIGFCLSAVPLGRLTRWWDVWNGRCRNLRSRYVTFGAGRRHYFGELAPRAGMEPVRSVTFEGRVCRVAKDVESYMVRLYGTDYVKPPPPDRRERHLYFEPFELKGMKS